MVPNILIFRCYDKNSKGEGTETLNRHDLVDQFDVEFLELVLHYVSIHRANRFHYSVLISYLIHHCKYVPFPSS